MIYFNHNNVIDKKTSLNLKTTQNQVKLLSVGQMHTCQIYIDSSLECEGSNEQKQLDIPAEQKINVVIVITGVSFTCIVQDLLNNNLYCFSSIKKILSIPEKFNKNIIKISGRQFHICAVNSLTDLACWGDDKISDDDSFLIIPDHMKTGITSIATTTQSTCAVKHNYQLFCWGHFTCEKTYKGILKIKDLSLGYGFIGILFEVGYLSQGKMENDESSFQKNAIIPPRGFQTDLKQITCNRKMCGLKNNGELGCWNPNNDNSVENIPEKYKKDIVYIDSNLIKTCVINQQLKAKCWSYDEKLKIPTNQSNNISHVVIQLDQKCVIDKNNKLGCWTQHNDRNKIILELDNVRDVSISENQKIKKIGYTTGKYLIYYVTLDGSLNQFALVGDEQILNAPKVTTPIPQAFKSNIVQVTSGISHACALRVSNLADPGAPGDSTLGCWGNNKFGQTDVPVDLQHGVVSAVAGIFHTCVVVHKTRSNVSQGALAGAGAESTSTSTQSQTHLTSVGKLKCWGENSNKQNDVPKQFRKVVQFDTKFQSVCAISLQTKLPGCWGHNENGQLDVPAGLQGKRQLQVKTSRYQSCALDAESRMSCWGSKNFASVPEKQRSGVTAMAVDIDTCVVVKEGDLKCWRGSS